MLVSRPMYDPSRSTFRDFEVSMFQWANYFDSEENI